MYVTLRVNSVNDYCNRLSLFSNEGWLPTDVLTWEKCILNRSALSPNPFALCEGVKGLEPNNKLDGSLQASSPGLSGGGQEKEREIGYLHWKSRCKMLIGRDELVMMSLPLACVFALICGKLTAQSTGSHIELNVEFKFQRHSCKLPFLFPPCRQSAPESLLAG